ncbi:uncharacterized protein LOC133506021 isoform X2 [Syngnathoides biaculeatus]|uniref:uncharacterized protein LOC133506021 isoform X2 n=1 Tax=Syngnathoides biaculeatus TaxID=300417 RepID=UPI002ADD8148|nr:uncharacterized protein LOC133506021 isoform X2 [Syngnathoides biaculeatus]
MPRCLHCKQTESGNTNCQPLEKLLPEGYEHLVCTYQNIAEGQFRAQIKLRITTEDEVHKWLEDFQSSSLLTWRKSKTYPQHLHTGGQNAYRVDLRCHHKCGSNSKAVPKKTKNTSCCATMYLVLKREMHSKNRLSRSQDPHIKDGYLFNINLRHEHNHRLFCSASMKRRDVSSETIDKLKLLFESGHSPSAALETIKHDLQDQEGNDSQGESIDEAPSTGSSKTSGTSSGEGLKAGLQQFYRTMTKKLEHDPENFTAPIRAFLEISSKMNDSAIISALHCFATEGGALEVKARYFAGTNQMARGRGFPLIVLGKENSRAVSWR